MAQHEEARATVRYLDLQHSKLVEYSDGSGSLHDNFGTTSIELSPEERIQLISKLPNLREKVEAILASDVDPSAIQLGPSGEKRYQTLLERIILKREDNQLRLVVSASLSATSEPDIRSYLRVFKGWNSPLTQLC